MGLHKTSPRPNNPVHSTSVGGHVAAGPVPTALSVGEWLNASGQDVVRAVALGYEVGGRLMTIFYRERDYTSRRFYHTAVAANVSSAVSAGVLLGLNRQALQVAMCLAAYQAAGPDNMTRDPVHMGKTFQVAAANRNGVTAALLARQGCFAPLDILDGTHGLFDAYLNNPEAGAGLLHDLGRYYAITDVMHKRYSAGTPNQTYLQALFRLLQANRIVPDQIQQIEVHLPMRGVTRVPTTRHASIAAVKVCAIAAATGHLDFYQLHGPADAVDAVIESMQPRITFVGREDWTGMEQGRHAIVIIRTREGRTFEDEVWHQPMTRAELEHKFRALVGPTFGAARTAKLHMLLSEVETAASIRPLMQELHG
jgi:2-methylcitrate dehydratase PrpD